MLEGSKQRGWLGGERVLTSALFVLDMDVLAGGLRWEAEAAD